MKIDNITCDYIIVPGEIPVRGTTRDFGVLPVTVEPDDGITGVGLGRHYDSFGRSVKTELLNDIAPFLNAKGELMVPGHLWHEAAFALPRSDYRAPTGVVAAAIGAVDQALWDIRGKILGEPVYHIDDFAALRAETAVPALVDRRAVTLASAHRVARSRAADGLVLKMWKTASFAKSLKWLPWSRPPVSLPPSVAPRRATCWRRRRSRMTARPSRASALPGIVMGMNVTADHDPIVTVPPEFQVRTAMSRCPPDPGWESRSTWAPFGTWPWPPTKSAEPAVDPNREFFRRYSTTQE